LSHEIRSWDLKIAQEKKFNKKKKNTNRNFCHRRMLRISNSLLLGFFRCPLPFPGEVFFQVYNPSLQISDRGRRIDGARDTSTINVGMEKYDTPRKPKIREVRPPAERKYERSTTWKGNIPLARGKKEGELMDCFAGVGRP